MKHEKRADFPTAFQSYGAGARNAVFLHCSLASHRAWMPVITQLSNELSVTAFDLPGHGRSGDWAPDDGDIHALSADIAATFCDGPTDIIGHSFGGAVALRLAVERPDLVRRMVLVEPVFFAAARGTDTHTRHREKFVPFNAAIERSDREAATRIFSDMWGGGQAFDDLPAAQRQAMIDRIHLIPASAPGIEHDSGNLMAPGRMERATAPTLLVSGTRSAPITDAIHDSLCARLPAAERHVIDGAGHMAPLSHAGIVADLIRDHLAA